MNSIRPLEGQARGYLKLNGAERQHWGSRIGQALVTGRRPAQLSAVAIIRSGQ
jgi:hypothetical protein